MSVDLRKRIIDLSKKAAFAAHKHGIEGQRAQLDMKILFSILTGIALALITVGTLAEKNAATPEESRITIPEKDCTYGPNTCSDGFVWRRAVPSDTVCVTPEVRTQTHIDNAKAGERRNPKGGRRGPNTCLSGYVWRKAFPGDVVCVKPRARSQAAQDNSQANARKACR